MDRWWYAVRFFRVVPPVSRLMVASFGVLTVSAGAALVVDPDRASRVVLPTLVLQAFAVSVGFTAFARRGYYDVLLTTGQNQAQ